MIKNSIIIVLLLVILFILFYKKITPKLSLFNSSLFKKTVGYISIAMILVLTIKFVKVIPLFLKVGVIGIDFILIYIIFTSLIKNKSK